MQTIRAKNILPVRLFPVIARITSGTGNSVLLQVSHVSKRDSYLRENTNDINSTQKVLFYFLFATYIKCKFKYKQRVKGRKLIVYIAGEEAQKKRLSYIHKVSPNKTSNTNI